MPDYVVIRNLAVASGDVPEPRTKSWEWSAGPFEGSTKSMREAEATAAGGAPAVPDIKVETLDPRQVSELANEPGVAALSPLMATSLIAPMEAAGAVLPNGDAWGIAAVKADVSKWNGEGVTVAVLDTGIDKDHSAFAGVNILEEDFTGAGNGDKQGHGTHCAGTIFGREVDGRRIGIAPGVEKVLVGKVLNDRGKGDSSMIFDGLKWAFDQKAQVISMSLGFDFAGAVGRMQKQGWPLDLATSATLEVYRANLRAFDSLMGMFKSMEEFAKGAVIVAATGNESRTNEDPKFKIAASLPAAAQGVISVGALRPDGPKYTVAPFSNIFPQVSAPGVDIVSAKVDGGLRSLSGTSMACPHVAGVAALWWQSIMVANAKPGEKPDPSSVKPSSVIDRLRANARVNQFDPGVGSDDRGAGIVTAP